MFKADLLHKTTRAIGVAALLGTLAPPARAQINAKLFTTYNVQGGGTSVGWVTCGATAQSEGCYSSGNLQPFGKVCAMLEDTAVIHGDTVKQHVYVLDTDYHGGHSLYLDAYRKTDVITQTYDTTTFKLQKRVALGVPAGSNAACYAAANQGYIYAGSSLGTSLVIVSKADYSVQTVNGFSPPIPVTSIQADDRGYVSVNFGSGN